MEKEIWKDIVGYEGLYQVSNMGNVKSLNYYNRGEENILTKSIRVGYNCVSMKGKMFYIHRLVAQAFIPNPENKPQVNHKNGIRDDNRLENLEWCTPKENIQHKFDVLGYKNNFQTNHHNKGKFGKDNLKSKKINQYTKEGEFIKTWYGSYDIERKLGIYQQNIGKVCLGKRNKAGGFIWKYAES